MAYTQLKPRQTKDAGVDAISQASSHYLLSIPQGKADNYRLAQLDDYAKTKREDFPLRFPLSLSLSARTSSSTIPGTWGFGLWNDPFGMSLGFGGSPFRLPALPNAVWFFGASQENYLSFKERSDENSSRSVDETRGIHETASSMGFSGNKQPSPAGFDTGAGSLRPTQPAEAANGFLAQSFCSPKFHPRLIPAGLALPFSRRTTRRLLGKVIDEDGTRLKVDVTQWHRYRLDWREKRIAFEVDDAIVFESSVSPNPPLGLVIWIDNQYA
ncbi:MAG TPA: hypothetical protein VJ785_17980, partial [Anaerolineales bacterium]|nr:hypothetical protein [Anaerolineales bacterium]